jgi:hypothetical protein
MNSNSALLFSRDTTPYGISFEEWTVLWWKWLMDTPKKINPTSDLVGDNAYRNQPALDVFFLCQTIEGSHPEPVRNISLPTGKSIFMPIINWISVSDVDGRTYEDLVNKASEKIEEVANLDLKINELSLDLDLRNFRVCSGLFNHVLLENNIFDLPPGVRSFVSDGYWIFLKPLDDSTILSSYGACSTGITQIGVTYNIKIRN